MVVTGDFVGMPYTTFLAVSNKGEPMVRNRTSVVPLGFIVGWWRSE
jgi:hypothetical protein